MSIERQPTVPIPTLLSKLAEIGVSVQEIDFPSHKVYLFGSKLPPFPFGEREYVWYPLTIQPGQVEIDRDEADALLRHCWHSSKPFFEDELEQELAPSDDREEEIASTVERHAGRVKAGDAQWDPTSVDRLRSTVSFEMSEAEHEYFDTLTNWKREL